MASSLTRRTLLRRAALAGAATFLCRSPVSGGGPVDGRNKICVFTKPLQHLSYDQMAETAAEMGFDGIEGTVRPGGHVLPERVEEDLPKMVEALEKYDLELTVMTSGINSLQQPLTEKVLKTAGGLGIGRYRMSYYRYDLKQPVIRQLDEFRPVLRDLVAFSREQGLTPVYQNHAGRDRVGAAIWDLHYLMEDYPVGDLATAFDIRHATVEGGLCWPVHFNLMRPHLGVVYVKDFQWKEGKPENVPLGQGRVDKKFFSMLKDSRYEGPISLHMEYIDHRDPGLVKQSVAAIRKDMKTLREWLGF